MFSQNPLYQRLACWLNGWRQDMSGRWTRARRAHDDPQRVSAHLGEVGRASISVKYLTDAHYLDWLSGMEQRKQWRAQHGR